MGPKPPDPVQTAAAQTKSNQATAVTQYELGATNQSGPGGSLTYKQIGTYPDGTPRYEAVTALSPQNQGVYDQLMTAAGTAAGGINAPIATPDYQTSIDTSGLSHLPTEGDYSVDRGRVEDAITARLNPELASSRASREQDLFNRGVRPGTAAYDRAMGAVGQQENDAHLQTILAGGQEQSRMMSDALAGRSQGYSEALNNGNFRNSALSQGFNDRMTARGQPINEITALFGGTQVGTPNFQQTPQPGVAGTDVAGITQNAYNQQVQRRQNIMTGLFGLGSSLVGAIPWSDRRLKSNIVRIGTHPVGVPLYEYDIFGERQRGVMADELEKVRPDAVHYDADGFAHVDYEAL